MTGNAPALRRRMISEEFQCWLLDDGGIEEMGARSLKEVDRMVNALTYRAEEGDDRCQIASDTINWMMGADTAPLTEAEICDTEEEMVEAEDFCAMD